VKCGRCGTNFTPYTDPDEADPVLVQAYPSWAVDQYGRHGATTDDDTPSGHLCTDCREAFLAFMEGDL